MDEKQFAVIDAKLNTIIRLFSAQLIKDKDYRDQVEFLYNAGLPYKDIAALTGKTENNVKVTLHLIKKAKKRST
jgi:DNA-directed RNA polymerase specialized sigma24 family protein